MSVVTAVVLAAGASERMGEPKLLLPYRGSTVLNATIAAVTASAVERIVVVTGFGADRVEASLEFLTSSFPSSSPVGREEEQESRDGNPSITVVRNVDFRRGNMSSLLTATTVDREAQAFIVVPGDMPTTRTAVVSAMVDLWREEEPWAAVTEYRDRIAHPFLLSRSAVEAVAPIAGEKILGRLLVDSGDDRIVRLPVPHVAPWDVNTPEDYEALISEL